MHLGYGRTGHAIRAVTVDVDKVFNLTSGNYSAQQQHHEHEHLEHLEFRPLKLPGTDTIVKGMCLYACLYP